MLKLIHAPQSRSSRIIWLLEETGAPFEIQYVDIARQTTGTGAPDPANPHPDKKVPALIDGVQMISESAAIALYLTDKFPAANLGPQIGDEKRGDYLTWLFYYQGTIEPLLVLSFAQIDHPAVHATFRGMPEMHARILKALERGPYILGDEFSAVDLMLASLGQWARAMLPEGEIMDGYLQRCLDRPAVARAGAKDAKPA
jgi:glutathione S-transferase